MNGRGSCRGLLLVAIMVATVGFGGSVAARGPEPTATPTKNARRGNSLCWLPQLRLVPVAATGAC
ncbi:MAG: hypothetical protein H6645_05405 [Caldilineaceae bacterium]|nr:hypothetical protein [Caldilineaceae bacterium]